MNALGFDARKLLCYIPPVTSVIGFGSPSHCSAKSRSIRMSCGFFVRATFSGGPDGRAQALPVCASGARSSNPFGLPPMFGSVCGSESTAPLARSIMAKSSSSKAAAPRIPTIVRNSFDPSPCDWGKLPFVTPTNARGKRRDMWVNPPVQSYIEGNVTGEQFAADYVQYLKQNPAWVGSGTMGHIAEAMYVTPIAKESGTAAGFWSLIERLLHYSAQHVDAYAMAQQSADRLTKWLAEHPDKDST